MVESGFRLFAAGLIDSAIRDVLTGEDEAGDALEWLHGSPVPLTFDDSAKAFRAEPEALREAILRLVREPPPELVRRFRGGRVLQIGSDGISQAPGGRGPKVGDISPTDRPFPLCWPAEPSYAVVVLRTLLNHCLLVTLLTVVAAGAMSGADQSEILSLKGLVGITVLVESPGPEAEQVGLTRDVLQTDAELKLWLAGIRVLTEQQYADLFPEAAVIYINVNSLGYDHRLISCSIGMSAQQQVTLFRQPSVKLTVETWGSRFAGYVGENTMRQFIRDGVKDHLDRFINDWLSVNPK